MQPNMDLLLQDSCGTAFLTQEGGDAIQVCAQLWVGVDLRGYLPACLQDSGVVSPSK